MKNTLFFFIALILLLSSCEKEYLIPSNEVPDWLKTKINEDEQIIKEQPRLMNAYGCWIRYSWNNENYFEYHNELSSSLPMAISFDGETKIPANIDNAYNREKCCLTYVWKGPNFSGFIGI
jgi:hypothetical protein